jgi:O-antigen/teichoic acid export membrane protein
VTRDGQVAMRNEASIVRNLGVLTLAQAATMLLNLAALVYSRNVLGPYWFGALQFGVAFSAYALVTAEWGLATLGVREVSRLDTAAAVRRYVGEHLGLMALLGALTLGLGAVVLPVFPIYRSDPVIFLVYLATVVPMVLSFDWVGIGLERLPWVSAAKTVRSLVYAVAVLALLRAWDGLGGWAAARWVPVFFLAGFLVSAALMAWRVRVWLGGWVWPTWPGRAEASRRLTATTAIGAGAITMRVLLNVDIILLGVVATPETVGDYAAAAKVIVVLLVGIEVLWNALVPRLSRAWMQDRAVFRRRYNSYLGLVILGLVPLAAGGMLFGHGLMDLLYGGRAPGAGAICRVLSLSYAALAVGQFLGYGLIASDRQRASFPPVAVGAVVAVVGVTVLARLRGAFGASLGMLASHLTLLVLSGWAARDLFLPILRRPLLVSLAGAAAMTAVAVVARALPFVAVSLVAAAAYAAVAVPLAATWWRQARG